MFAATASGSEHQEWSYEGPTGPLNWGKLPGSAMCETGTQPVADQHRGRVANTPRSRCSPRYAGGQQGHRQQRPHHPGRLRARRHAGRRQRDVHPPTDALPRSEREPDRRAVVSDGSFSRTSLSTPCLSQRNTSNLSRPGSDVLRASADIQTLGASDGAPFAQGNRSKVKRLTGGAWLCAATAVAFLLLPVSASAQELEPGAYWPIPRG